MMTRRYSARSGTLDARQLFDGQRVGPVVGEGAEIVEAVGVGHRAEIGLVLGDLFVVAMEVTEDGLEFDDAFAVEHDVHAEDAVGGRVLRAHRDFEQLFFAAVGCRVQHCARADGIGRGAHLPPDFGVDAGSARCRTSSCAVGSYS